MSAWGGQFGVALGAFLAATNVFAMDTAWDACEMPTVDQRRIASCTEVLGRGERETQSKRSQAYVSRGAAYQFKFDYDQAIADYSEAIRLDPKNADIYSRRGTAYQLKSDYDRAIADYSEAIRLDPKNANIY